MSLGERTQTYTQRTHMRYGRCQISNEKRVIFRFSTRISGIAQSSTFDLVRLYERAILVALLFTPSTVG